MGSSSSAAGSIKVFGGAAVGLALGVISLVLRDSRLTVVGTPPIIALVGYVGYTEESMSFMYGKVNREETRQFIKASLTLALVCLYAWQITRWGDTDVSMVTTYGVTASLLATLLWTTLFSYTSVRALPTDNYRGTMVALLAMSAVFMIAAAYNAGDPIDWLIWPAFHATALDAGAWSVGVYEL